jgi:hypothetical protein
VGSWWTSCGGPWSSPRARASPRTRGIDGWSGQPRGTTKHDPRWADTPVYGVRRTNPNLRGAPVSAASGPSRHVPSTRINDTPRAGARDEPPRRPDRPDRPRTGRPSSRPASTPPGPPTPDPPSRETASRSTKLWGAVGAVVLSVLAVVLATTLGDGERPGRSPELEPDPSFTPSDVVPEAPIPEPVVRGRRAGRDVTFTWRVVGGGWHQGRRHLGLAPPGHRRERPRDRPGADRHGAARVCLQVQLIRDGEPSTSTRECVE